MTALWWIGLTATLLGILTPNNEQAARRLAAIGVALLTLNAIHAWMNL